MKNSVKLWAGGAAAIAVIFGVASRLGDQVGGTVSAPAQDASADALMPPAADAAAQNSPASSPDQARQETPPPSQKSSAENLLLLFNESHFSQSLPFPWQDNLQFNGQLPHRHLSALDLIATGNLVSTGWSIRKGDQPGREEASCLAIDPDTGALYILSVEHHEEVSPEGNVVQRDMMFVMETDAVGALSHFSQVNGSGPIGYGEAPEETFIGDTPSFWMRVKTYNPQGQVIADIHQLRWDNRDRNEGPTRFVFNMHNGANRIAVAWGESGVRDSVVEMPDGSYSYSNERGAVYGDYNTWPSYITHYLDNYNAWRSAGFGHAPSSPSGP